MAGKDKTVAAVEYFFAMAEAGIAVTTVYGDDDIEHDHRTVRDHVLSILRQLPADTVRIRSKLRNDY